MKNTEQFYGVYVSPYCHNGQPYVGSAKSCEASCYEACGTDEHILGVFTSEEEAHQFAEDEYIVRKLRSICNGENLQFRREWVVIRYELGYAAVINDNDRILARLTI